MKKKPFDIIHIDELSEMDYSKQYSVIENMPSDSLIDCLSLEFIPHDDDYSQTILSILHELRYRIIDRYYIGKDLKNGK